MKVKWQSDAPNMELVIPTGQYLPYELPVATKEVLGGVKVDGDTINITSDGVISTQKVDLSGVATKVELEEVENKIPDISGLATKNELATVESKIPDTSGLATKIELTAVENKIPDVSGFATKDEIPNVSGLATKVELNEVAATIPNSDDLATKAELNAVQSSIPDTTGLATKVELSNVEAKIPDTSGLATKVELQTVEGSIPSEYLKNASVADNKLTITKSSGDTIEFSGGSSGGGGSSGSSIPVYSFTSGQELTAEEKGQLDIIKNNPKSVIVYIDGLKANNINFVSDTIAFSVGGDATITAGTGTTGRIRYYEPQHGGLYLYSYQLSRIYDTISDSFITVDDTKITRVRSADFPVVTNIENLGEYSNLDINFITNWIHNPNQYNVTVSNKPVIYVDNNRNSTSVEAYTLSASYAGLALGGTTLHFSNNKKLAFDSNRTRYYSLGETILLDSQNWQNYISLGGQSSWTYTNSTSDSSLYNATELIIMWSYDNAYYCNYYKFDQGSGSTLGGNYQWNTFNAYDHSNGSGTSSWYYDGSNINTSNMEILGLYYKT